MTPLRILHAEAATAFGGQEHRIFKEMLAMRDHGHHLELVCQPHAQLATRLRAEGFVVHTTKMAGAVNFLCSIGRIWKIARQGRFDVINTHSRKDTLIAGIAGRLAGTPLIVRTRHLAKKPGSLLSYSVVPHRVTTVSDHVRKLLVDRGVKPQRVATVYSPIQPAAVVEHSTLRQELALAPDDIIVGCVAVMRAKKGHLALIDAIEPLLMETPNLHMVFVGSGSPTFERVSEYIGARGLTSRVHLMGTRTDVPNLLAGFDIFALATEEEASGTVFVEAAAAGLPVVGTDVGGVAEMMQNGTTGILVPLHDQAALTAALKTLIEDPGLRLRMGQAGQRLVREEGKFSLESLVRHTEACYARWLSERKS